jgi:hypothetical protein
MERLQDSDNIDSASSGIFYEDFKQVEVVVAVEFFWLTWSR